MTTFANHVTGTVGTNVTVANSAAGGDAFTLVVKGTGSTITYETMPWGGIGARVTATTTTDSPYLRWDDKASGTVGPDGYILFPLWLDAIPTAQVVHAQIRDTAGTATMVSLKSAFNNYNKLVLSQVGGSDIAATLSTTVLQAQHLYWVGLQVRAGATTSNGRLGYTLYDSDGVTVLETKLSTTANTGTNNPGEFRIGSAAPSTYVPRSQYVQDVQAGHGATLPGPLADPVAVVASIPSQDVEPGAPVTVTASLKSGSASTWTWVQTSGPAVTLNPSGATLTFTSPKPLPPDSATIVLSVTADGSAPVTATVTVRPHLVWSRQPGQSWMASGLTA